MTVFTERGYAATRTEDIAKAAGINRALLHYYYTDKQTIFQLIFESRFREFFQGLFAILDTQDTLLGKIEKIIEHEINVLCAHPDLPRFIIMEVAQQPELLFEHGKKLGLNPVVLMQRFERDVQIEVDKGAIRPIAGKALLINIMSLSIYPFVARPILLKLMQVDQEGFKVMMQNRKKELFDFIVHAIK